MYKYEKSSNSVYRSNSNCSSYRMVRMEVCNFCGTPYMACYFIASYLQHDTFGFVAPVHRAISNVFLRKREVSSFAREKQEDYLKFPREVSLAKIMCPRGTMVRYILQLSVKYCVAIVVTIYASFPSYHAQTIVIHGNFKFM